MSSASKNFRTDINGLRAWAVVAVVCFHFGIPGFSGGFVGVDIFFAISGFLMTGIILRGLEKAALPGAIQSFSIIDFYLARARRIIPAQLVLCAVLLPLGWLWLPAVEYKVLGSHIVSALGFFSNMVFWHDAGYFDSDSHDKLLLHTWSLSVEWQFYLILPLVLATVWKLHPGRRTQLWVITAGMLLSVALCIVATPARPSAAFYLLPTRAWEMLAGGLVYLWFGHITLSALWQRVLEAAGFALIIASLLLFDADTVWPGWHALVPVLGTVLVLTAARQNSLWTGTRVAQWLGDCSYSLYLWHWPLVVALVYLHLEKSAPAIVAGLLVTLVLGRLSYSLIENRTRTALDRLPKWRGAAALAVTLLIVMVPSQVVHQDAGIPGRLSAQIDAVFNESENINPDQKRCLVSEFSTPPECVHGGEQTGVIVIGDSHAEAMVHAVEDALPAARFNVRNLTMSNCPTIANVKAIDQPTYTCGKYIAQKVQELEHSDDHTPLIIINRTSYYALGPNEPDRTRELAVPYLYFDKPYQARTPQFFSDIREEIISTACSFASNRPVYMMRPVPELMFNVPKTMGRALMQGKHVRISMSMAQYQERNDFIWKTQDMAAERCGVKILDPLPYLCHDGQCTGDVAGLPVYYDDDHLNMDGASLLTPMFRQVFNTPAEANSMTAGQ
jgi:peptidoglycan/LPS O-acetylase OafA/YrhL